MDSNVFKPKCHYNLIPDNEERLNLETRLALFGYRVTLFGAQKGILLV